MSLMCISVVAIPIQMNDHGAFQSALLGFIRVMVLYPDLESWDYIIMIL